jgi:hypothetical protein
MNDKESSAERKRKQKQAYHAMVARNAKFYRAAAHGSKAGRKGISKTGSIMEQD